MYLLTWIKLFQLYFFEKENRKKVSFFHLVNLYIDIKRGNANEENFQPYFMTNIFCKDIENICKRFIKILMLNIEIKWFKINKKYSFLLKTNSASKKN